MLAWWVILFSLGVVSFLDTFLGVGDSFSQITAAVFILASLGLLTRIARKTREGEKEQMAERIAHLESELLIARSARPHAKLDSTPTHKEAVGV